MFSYCIMPRLFQPRLRVIVSRAHARAHACACTCRCVDWSVIYPAHCAGENKEMQRPIDFADIGCGFGGLLVQLGEKFPDKISLGIEIREKVRLHMSINASDALLHAPEILMSFFLLLLFNNKKFYNNIIFKKGGFIRGSTHQGLACRKSR